MTNAQKFFDENIRLLPNPISSGTADQQRQYNLYSGLRALAMQVGQIQMAQTQMRQDMQHLEQVVRGLR